MLIRGVARNFLGGQKRRFGGRKSPSGVQGQSPVAVWGRSAQKPETNAEHSTEQSHRHKLRPIILRKHFQLRLGGGDMHPCPLATPLMLMVGWQEGHVDLPVEVLFPSNKLHKSTTIVDAAYVTPENWSVKQKTKVVYIFESSTTTKGTVDPEGTRLLTCCTMCLR